MKKVIFRGFIILLSFIAVHGITCYKCHAEFQDTCWRNAVECDKKTDPCVTESLYSTSGQFLGVYARCATGRDLTRCGTTLMFQTEIKITNCCYTDKCNGKRSPFPPAECAKPASKT